jgi:UDP-glucose 4-epimerase
MKIVITGALGHIGSKIIHEIPSVFSETIKIVMIDNMLTQRYCSLFNLPDNAKYTFIESDVLKLNLIDIIKDADVVLHLAAITNAEKSFENKDQVEAVNYDATRRVAEACTRAGCPMIHISSTSVYGTSKDIIDENCSKEELKPQSPYAETKLKEEDVLKRLGKSNGLNFVICRFGTICGVSKGMRFHTAVNKFCWQATMKQPLTVWRTALHQKRPYLTLDDALNAIIFIINNKLFDNNIYNILTKNLTVNDIILYIKKYVPEILINYVDTPIMNQLSYEVLNKLFINKGFKYTGRVNNCIKETINLIKN